MEAIACTIKVNKEMMEFVSLETTFRFLYKIDTLHTHTERDTESRYHSVVSYITYLLKRPFFSVLGLVPI